MDADDKFIRNDALALINKKINSDKCDIIIYNYSYNKQGIIKFNDKYRSINEVIGITLCGNEQNSLCNKAINSTLIKDIDFPMANNVLIAEDRLMFLYILKQAKSVCYIDLVLYLYRKNNKSISNLLLDKERLQCQINVERIIKDIYKGNPKTKYSFESYYFEHILYPHL